MIPQTSLSNTVMTTHQTQTTIQSHHCELCSTSYPTLKQLRIHETTKHNIRCAATLLTPTNCCPNCNTIFASQASAIQHLENSMCKGYCTSHRSHNLQQLVVPTHLHCALRTISNLKLACARWCQRNLTKYAKHVRVHGDFSR